MDIFLNHATLLEHVLHVYQEIFLQEHFFIANQTF